MITQVISKRISFAGKVVVVALALVATSGCGGVAYAVKAGGAASSLEQAKELGADRLAPFEYYMAQEHLYKARQEAADGDYGDAIDLADDADEFATKAVRLSREAHRGAGR